ncbi:hypothetical protein [Streptomyces sp. NPDC058045]|uniref:hypothetical protein n=1 Tax=Streptomyces sp. NPDC058045 TaxID=3346311 RepID=UPI0036F07F98
MTTQSTEPEQSTADNPQRGSYMAALSLAEQIISETHTLPTVFEVAAPPWAATEPVLRFNFHMDVPGLRRFRDEQHLTETSETRKDGSTYIEATGHVYDVRVVAWTLTDPAPGLPVPLAESPAAQPPTAADAEAVT